MIIDRNISNCTLAAISCCGELPLDWLALTDYNRREFISLRSMCKATETEIEPITWAKTCPFITHGYPLAMYATTPITLSDCKYTTMNLTKANMNMCMN